MTETEPHLVVVGASLAGLRAVESARRAGFAGAITLVGAEEHPPYDRPPLSKEFLTAAEQPAAADVARRGGAARRAAGAPSARCRRLPASTPRVAPSASATSRCTTPAWCWRPARRPRSLPGAERLCRRPHPAHPRRRAGDPSRARRRRPHRRRRRRLHRIRDRVLGPAARLDRHRRRGDADPAGSTRRRADGLGAGGPARTQRDHAAVRGRRRRARGRPSRWRRCGSPTARRIEADLVVVGVGVAPATEWLADSGLELADGVECDKTLQTSAPGVYAAGDIASWPNPTFDTRMRLEHWTIAAEQGGAAGRNAARSRCRDGVRDSAVLLVGLVRQADPVRRRRGGCGRGRRSSPGDLEGDTFLVLYRRGDRLIGALGLEQRSQVMKYRMMIGKAGDAGPRRSTSPRPGPRRQRQSPPTLTRPADADYRRSRDVAAESPPGAAAGSPRPPPAASCG